MLTPKQIWEVQHERTSQLRMELANKGAYKGESNTLSYEQEEELFAKQLLALSDQQRKYSSR